MSDVKVRKLVGEFPIVTAVLSGIASFDAEGIAEVSAEIAEVLLGIEGEYTLADASEGDALKEQLKENAQLQAEADTKAAEAQAQALQDSADAQERADQEAADLLKDAEDEDADEDKEEVAKTASEETSFVAPVTHAAAPTRRKAPAVAK